jgi:predicted nucleic acid-binding protein
LTVLVHSSVWIEFLRGTGSTANAWVRDAIAEERPVAWTEPVLLELLAGARSQRAATDLRALLRRGPLLRVEGLTDWEVAATLHRSTRARGLPVRSTMDCLIAAVALRNGVPLATRDRDHATLARVCPLELVEFH